MIGGDGPKRILFEEMIERHNLQVKTTIFPQVAYTYIFLKKIYI